MGEFFRAVAQGIGFMVGRAIGRVLLFVLIVGAVLLYLNCQGSA